MDENHHGGEKHSSNVKLPEGKNENHGEFPWSQSNRPRGLWVVLVPLTTWDDLHALLCKSRQVLQQQLLWCHMWLHPLLKHQYWTGLILGEVVFNIMGKGLRWIKLHADFSNWRWMKSVWPFFGHPLKSTRSCWARVDIGRFLAGYICL